MTINLNRWTTKVEFSKILSLVNFSWIIGILCLSVPYNIFWSLGNGNFGYDILNTVGLSVVGVVVLLFHFRRHDKVNLNDGKKYAVIDYVIFGFHFVLLIGLVGLAYLNLRLDLYLSFLGATIVFQWAVLIHSQLKNHSGKSREIIRPLLNRSWETNGVFWISLLSTLIYSDLYLLGSIETDNGFEFTGTMLNRVCTQIVLVLGILLIFRVVHSLTPKHFKLLNYLIVSIFRFSPSPHSF